MNQLNKISVDVGAGSNIRVLVSCVDYNHEVLSLSDFQDQVVEQVLDYYHARLLNNTSALQTLLSDGINKAVIKQHRIGLCDRTLNLHIANARTYNGACVRGILEVHGLIRPSGHETLRGCVIVPLTNEKGMVSGIFAKRMAQYVQQSSKRFTLWFATQNAINTAIFPDIVEVLRRAK
ncbi:hypothetical protein ACFO4O_01425 [Glaciecola siphonariae]|uniref:Uncharacterized protein n=1 Tax=Glaciecola siphonariae TaxID=521012 RepID=A0ABV9LRC2_9ALTE